eukprot:3546584-Rhodomonas_salina.1
MRPQLATPYSDTVPEVLGHVPLLVYVTTRDVLQPVSNSVRRAPGAGSQHAMGHSEVTGRTAPALLFLSFPFFATLDGDVEGTGNGSV